MEQGYVKKKNLKNPQWIRDIKVRKLPFYKFYKPKFDKFIFDGGWHFSSVKTPKDIYQKLDSYAEQKWNNDDFKNLDIIKKRIEQKQDLFKRGYEFKVIKIDKTFPEYLVNNTEKFRDFIYSE